MPGFAQKVTQDWYIVTEENGRTGRTRKAFGKRLFLAIESDISSTIWGQPWLRRSWPTKAWKSIMRHFGAGCSRQAIGKNSASAKSTAPGANDEVILENWFRWMAATTIGSDQTMARRA